MMFKNDNVINKKLVNQLNDMLPFKFKLTTLDFDLKYHADLKVLNGDKTEYWLMRYRRLPRKDFTIRTMARKYKSEFEKIYNNDTLSKRYLFILLDEKYDMQEIYIINNNRLSESRAFLDYIYKNQCKNEFVYITPSQLFEHNLVDYYINYKVL